MAWFRLVCSIVTAVLVFSHLVVLSPPSMASGVDGDGHVETVSVFRQVSTEGGANSTSTRSASTGGGGFSISIDKTSYTVSEPAPRVKFSYPRGYRGHAHWVVMDTNGSLVRKCESLYYSCFHRLALSAPGEQSKRYRVNLHGPRGHVVATDEFTITNKGYEPSKVVFTADKTSYMEGAELPRLSLELEPAKTGRYSVSVYDSAGYRRCLGMGMYGACSRNRRLSAAPDKSEKYTLFVALDAPQRGFPTKGVQVTEELVITNRGYEPSKVVFTADKTSYMEGAELPRLSLELEPAKTGRYSVSVYDSAGYRRCLGMGMYGACSRNRRLSAAPDKSEKYTLFVALDAPQRGFPTKGVQVTKELVVNNLGWAGTISASSHKPANLLLSAKVQLKATPELPGYLSIWYSVGTTGKFNRCDRKRYCDLLLSRFGSESIVAVVAPTDATPGALGGARASAFVGMKNGNVVAVENAALNKQQLKTLGKLTRDRMRELLIEWRKYKVDRHQLKSSAPDQVLLFDAMIAAGVSLSTALLAVMSYCQQCVRDVGTESDPPAEPPTPKPTPPVLPPGGGSSNTGGTAPSANNTVKKLEERAFQSIMRRRGNFDKRNPGVSSDDKERLYRIAAKECVRRVQAAKVAGEAMPGAEVLNPKACESHSILFSGDSEPEVTAHIDEAITKTPFWVKLNFVTREEANKGVHSYSRGWYQGRGRCAKRKTGEDCDEYPFGASAQAGPAQPPVNKDASLLPVNSSQNRSHGAKYGYMARVCGFRSGGTTATAMNPNGTPFLVVALPADLKTNTFHICGPKR